MKKQSILFLCFLAGFFVYGESLQFYDFKNIIPSQSISAIVQDSNGNMWFGTRGSGVVKYNGSGIEIFNTEPFVEDCVPSSKIQSLYVNGEFLWVGSYAGLSSININSNEIRNYVLNDDVICTVLNDSKNSLWVGTLKGICLLDRDTGEYVTYLPNIAVRGIVETSNGSIFACTYDGVYEYNSISFSFEKAKFLSDENPSGQGTVYTLYEDKDGYYWTTCWGVGLVKTNPETKDFNLYPLKDNRMYSFVVDEINNMFYIGTWGGGLQVFYAETLENNVYNTAGVGRKKIPNNTVYSLCIDSFNLLWVGTHGGGITTYDRKRDRFEKLVLADNKNYGINSGAITDLKLDNDIIWAVIKNDGINKYNFVTQEVTEYNPKIGNLDTSVIYFILPDSRENVFIGTNKGLYTYDSKQDFFYPVDWYKPYMDSEENYLVNTMAEDFDGSYWIGTYGGELFHFSQYGELINKYKYNPNDSTSISNTICYFIYCDSDGRLWIGTNGGLNEYNRKQNSFIHYKYDVKKTDGIAGNSVISIYEDSFGDLWIGMNGSGISVYDKRKNKFTSYSQKDGLVSNSVVGINQTDGNTYWISTNKGLSVFNKETNQFISYTNVDGLESDQFQSPQLSLLDGTVLFASSQGVVLFSDNWKTVDEINSKKITKRTKISSVAINGINYPFSNSKNKIATFLSSTQTITFSFSSLDFSPLAQSTYSYNLEGFDQKKTEETDVSTVQYTNLPAGKYTFYVKSNELLDSTEDSGDSFSFIIKKPWYKTWYFVVLFMCAIIAIVYGVDKLIKLNNIATQMEISNKELEQLSYTDTLTGVDNRRSLIRLCEEVWHRAIAKKQKVIVMMLDIDFFKNYNDMYGHLSGDVVLKDVAQALRSCIIENKGVLFRYGGEEFIVIMIDTPMEMAKKIAEDMRNNVYDLEIPSAAESNKNLSVSIGVYGSVPSKECSWCTFIERADKALYAAKASGRNCVRFYEGK